MKQNTTWSALIISILITVIIIVIAIYLLEKIIPFSRDIKGVENGNVSYYRANTALNEALLSMSGSNPGYETGSVASLYTAGSGMVYTVTASGTVLPQPGLWNSEYDANWSILGPGKPIQLVLSTNLNWDTPNTYLNFRVPDLDKIATETLTGSLGNLTPIINWSLSASGDTLQASGSQILANLPVVSNASSGTVFFNTTKLWLTLSWTANNFSAFYNAKCNSTEKCTLKLSLINPLILTSGEKAPYLEYQARFNATVPLQTAVVQTQGYAGGFRKNITRFIQQMTTNEALDFTVFQ